MRKAQMKYLTAYWITLLEVKYVLEREVMMSNDDPLLPPNRGTETVRTQLEGQCLNKL